jgi:hypothetical protein
VRGHKAFNRKMDLKSNGKPFFIKVQKDKSLIFKVWRLLRTSVKG